MPILGYKAQFIIGAKPISFSHSSKQLSLSQDTLDLSRKPVIFLAIPREDISTNMEGESRKLLTHVMQNMIEFQSNISDLETKMQAMMRECKEGLIKRARNSEKNSSMGWMKASHTSNEESSSRAVITMKARVVEAGIQLCNLVIDFVFMMSRRDELAEKIGKFKATFKWATKLNSVVIDKIVNLMEMADREVRKMRRSEELKNKGKSVIADGNQDERSKERIRVKQLVDQFFERIQYKIFVQFLEAVLYLEVITSHRRLSYSGLVMKKVLLMLKCDVKHCETVVELLRQDIMALRTMFPFKSEFEDAKMVEARNFMAPKIYELWIGLLDSSEQDVHRIRYAREMGIQSNLEGDVAAMNDENDIVEDDLDDRKRYSVEVQPTLNGGGEFQEPREEQVEVEKEAKKPSKVCYCC
jgi:hypothetical protein